MRFSVGRCNSIRFDCMQWNWHRSDLLYHCQRHLHYHYLCHQFVRLWKHSPLSSDAHCSGLTTLPPRIDRNCSLQVSHHNESSQVWCSRLPVLLYKDQSTNTKLKRKTPECRQQKCDAHWCKYMKSHPPIPVLFSPGPIRMTEALRFPLFHWNVQRRTSGFDQVFASTPSVHSRSRFRFSCGQLMISSNFDHRSCAMSPCHQWGLLIELLWNCYSI